MKKNFTVLTLLVGASFFASIEAKAACGVDPAKVSDCLSSCITTKTIVLNSMYIPDVSKSINKIKDCITKSAGTTCNMCKE